MGAARINQESQVDAVYEKLKDMQSDEDKIIELKKLKLRYFDPKEIANLMGFPNEFSFPDELSTMQKYRVLGNSLNVKIVSMLIQICM